jgi:putative Mn2+ efflux pump MntP
MSHIFSGILLAFSSNIDNLGVGIAYGIMTRRILLSHNILIGVVSGTGTLLSMVAGEWVNNYMSENAANILGSGILILIGLYSIYRAVAEGQKKLERDESLLNDKPDVVQKREAYALALSLTINNLGGGLGAGISHVPIPLTTLLTMILSVAAIAAGYKLGESSTDIIPKLWLGVASGLIITILGVYEFFV